MQDFKEVQISKCTKLDRVQDCHIPPLKQGQQQKINFTTDIIYISRNELCGPIVAHCEDLRNLKALPKFQGQGLKKPQL